MKIGFLLLQNHGGIGGTEQVLIDICHGFEQKGIESHIYFTHQPQHVEFSRQFKHTNSYPVPRLLRDKHPLRPRFLFKYFFKRNTIELFNKIKEDKLDAVLVLDLDSSFLQHHALITELKQSTHIPIIAWPHGSIKQMLKQQQDFFQKMQIFDAIFAISDGLSKEMNQLGLKNITTVYNPITQAPIIKRNIKKLLYIGRIDDNKRVYELVQLVSRLDDAEWTLDIIGSTGKKEQDKQFSQFINKYNTRQQIVFHGWKKDPWSQVEEAGILLLNSKSEGFALVLAEAMTRGIPCISSNCPVGPADIIHSGHNGWLFDPDNEDELLAILNSILNGSLALPAAKEIQNSVQKFEFSNVVNRFIQALEHTIQRQ